MKERNIMNTTGIGKHVIAVLAIFAVIFFFSGCSSTPTPTETTDTFLQALKAQDSETMATVYSGEDINLLDAAAEAEESEEAEEAEEAADDLGMTKIYEEQMLPKILDFDYELSNEQIKEDKATVDVKVTTYRIGDACTAFFSDYISQAFMLAFSDVSEEELESLATTILSGKLADLTEKNYEKTVTLALSKTDGKWMVDAIQPGDDTVDAITGGLVTAFSNMEDAFSAWEEEE